MRVAGLESDVFRGQREPLVDVELATALRLIDRIRLVARQQMPLKRVAPRKVSSHGTPPVAVVPVLRRTPGHRGEQAGGRQCTRNQGKPATHRTLGKLRFATVFTRWQRWSRKCSLHTPRLRAGEAACEGLRARWTRAPGP